MCVGLAFLALALRQWSALVLADKIRRVLSVKCRFATERLA